MVNLAAMLHATDAPPRVFELLLESLIERLRLKCILTCKYPLPYDAHVVQACTCLLRV